jgi:hypothetical protein
MFKLCNTDFLPKISHLIDHFVGCLNGTESGIVTHKPGATESKYSIFHDKLDTNFIFHFIFGQTVIELHKMHIYGDIST